MTKEPDNYPDKGMGEFSTFTDVDGNEWPALVVHVNDQEGGDHAATVKVFTTNGDYLEVIHKPDTQDTPQEDPAVAAEPADAKSWLDSLTPEERQQVFASSGANPSDTGGQTPPPAPPQQ